MKSREEELFRRVTGLEKDNSALKQRIARIEQSMGKSAPNTLLAGDAEARRGSGSLEEAVRQTNGDVDAMKGNGDAD